ncbi:MAG: PadR family transcriptional regulator [Candidatus Dadabacteria bacterium]|nr:MAG: PadR family transcriptional regulator [Candidatus Dadabacteria bacterium]
MSLRHVILGLLDRDPMSGYDIKKRLREDLPGFWNVSDGQLYPMLRRLEQDGAIQPYTDHLRDEDRHAWTITEAGREELHAWLLEPVRRIGDFKDPFLMRLAFFDRLPRSVVEQRLRSQMRQGADFQDRIEDARSTYQPGVTSFQRTLLDYALLGAEIRACFLDVLAIRASQGTLSRTEPLLDEEQLLVLRRALDEIRDLAREAHTPRVLARTAAA